MLCPSPSSLSKGKGLTARFPGSMYNRGQAYVTRSLVLENAALIRKNYDAAFSGNRQLANQVRIPYACA